MRDIFAYFNNQIYHQIHYFYKNKSKNYADHFKQICQHNAQDAFDVIS